MREAERLRPVRRGDDVIQYGAVPKGEKVVEVDPADGRVIDDIFVFGDDAIRDYEFFGVVTEIEPRASE